MGTYNRACNARLEGEKNVNKQQYIDLEVQAKRLSKELGYVAEMARLSSQLVHTTEKLLSLMEENSQKDGTYGALVAQVNGAAVSKVQLADKWLIENRSKLDRWVERLSNEVVTDETA